MLLSLRSAFATPPDASADTSEGSVARPLTPQYHLNPNSGVTLRICFNWSCSTQEMLTFSAADMAEVTRQMALCAVDSTTLHERLQRLRIGIWQMELLARKYRPELANDRALNDQDEGVEGRTDCVDNASNTTTFLHILQDSSALSGWSVLTPQVRGLFSVIGVHWTAVVAEQDSGTRWSVDSWFRPHGHLPFVMPLADWMAGKKGWVTPLDELNPYPQYADQLCKARAADAGLSLTPAAAPHRYTPRAPGKG